MSFAAHELVHGMLRAYTPNYANEFLSYENENQYKNNLEKLGPEWEYADKKIYYKYNSLGHRSCELNELTSDYILFSGCSFTEGVGLALDDIYGVMIAKTLNKQYYNLGVGGSCPTIAAKNMIAFLSVMQNLPAAIIIQWPYFFRFYRISAEYRIQHLTPSEKISLYYNFMTKEKHAFRMNVLERAFFLHYLNNIGYKGQIIEMFSETYEELNEIIENSIAIPIKTNYFSMPNRVDYARDLGHPGSLTHNLYAAKILELLK